MQESLASSRGLSLADPEVIECPFAAYDQMRSGGPVYIDPVTGFHVVTRYEDVRRVLMDTTNFVSAGMIEKVRDSLDPARAARMRRIFLEKGWLPSPTLGHLDNPRHRQVRALFDSAFRPSKIMEMDETVRNMAYRIIEGLPDEGACEIVARYAVPLPLTVIGLQMGANEHDIWKIKSWTDAWIRRFGMMQREEDEIACVEAEIEAQHYFKPILDRLRAYPDKTVLSDLVNTAMGDGKTLTDNEILAHLMADTFVGGSETTTNALSAGVMLLARNPQQAANLRANPEKYLKPFYEEVLRLESPVQVLFRIAARDTQIGDSLIPGGALVGIAYAAANRDPRRFDCPAEMNLDRAHPGAHLAFGSGIHHCLGAPLARRELHWGFLALIERLDDIRLDESKNNFLHMPNLMLRALKELHITYRKVA